jgi:hypothetical protein
MTKTILRFFDSSSLWLRSALLFSLCVPFAFILVCSYGFLFERSEIWGDFMTLDAVVVRPSLHRPGKVIYRYVVSDKYYEFMGFPGKGGSAAIGQRIPIWVGVEDNSLIFTYPMPNGLSRQMSIFLFRSLEISFALALIYWASEAKFPWQK